MLTRDLLRARRRKDQVLPQYVDLADPALGALAAELIELFVSHRERPRGELEEALVARIGERTDFLLHRGLAKLLFDRATFVTDAKLDPREVRKALFLRAAASHPVARQAGVPLHPIHRAAVLAEVAGTMSATPEEIEKAFYADLEEAQVLREFETLTAAELLQRYNVALAQAVLLRATQVMVKLEPTAAKRVRQLFRFIKFFGLMHQAEGTAKKGYTLTLDGPASLFRLSTKYGLQLAEFLPALLLCPGWTLRAELEWGTDRRPAWFGVTAAEGLVSHYRDTGTYETEEERAFRERWATLETPWKLDRASTLIDLDGRGVLVPDFTLRHPDGRVALLEIVGFWRRTYLESRLALLQQHGPAHLILAVSQRLRSSEEDLARVPGEAFFFKDVIPTREILERAERVGRVP